MTTNRPNVLFVLTDDHRHDTIGALGNPHIRTPNLDRLVDRGSAFHRHFCTTPICTPARAEILTGCSSFHNQVPWFGMPINPELTLLPAAFHDAGYHTIHVGKWHNDGHPRDKGYDRVRRVFHQDNLNHYQESGHWMRFAEDGGEVEGHSTEIFTDAAIEEVAAAGEDQPWFCYLAYHAPHDPHHAPEPFASMYQGRLRCCRTTCRSIRSTTATCSSATNCSSSGPAPPPRCSSTSRATMARSAIWITISGG